MKTVALVDWNWMGHHPTYYHGLLRGFVELGCRVAAFCPPDAIGEVSALASESETVSVEGCRYLQPRNRLPRWIREREQAWRMFGGLDRKFREWERKHGGSIDLVFFSTIYDFQFEHFCHAKSCFRRPWSGIYLHARAFRMPGSPMPYFNRLPCPEKIFKHPSMTSVCVIDEGAVEPMRTLTDGKASFEFPDITGTEFDTSVQRDSLVGKLIRFASGRKIVVCLGHLQRTKGLVELCQVARLPDVADICFFFGGEVNWGGFNPQEVDLIRSTWERAPNVMTHLDRLSDATLNALIKVSDVVFAAYTNFPNSSNIMTKAAYLERPILVSDGYLMAERVRKYRLGAIVTEGSVSDIHQQILRLCSQGGDPNADYKGYYANHSPKALSAALAKVLDAAGGKRDEYNTASKA